MIYFSFCIWYFIIENMTFVQRRMRMDLTRFLRAQATDYTTALSELRQGRKTSHWMWYIFPQLKGLGRSYTADYFGISGLAEARAYVADPILGPRLSEAAQALLMHPDKTAPEILGYTDALKLRSSMTLFREAAPEIPVFAQVLQTFFDGTSDTLTLRLLEK